MGHAPRRHARGPETRRRSIPDREKGEPASVSARSGCALGRPEAAHDRGSFTYAGNPGDVLDDDVGQERCGPDQVVGPTGCDPLIDPWLPDVLADGHE